MHDREGPIRALFAALTADGRRVWGNSTDDATMQTAMAEELCGTSAHLAADGVLHLN